MMPETPEIPPTPEVPPVMPAALVESSATATGLPANLAAGLAEFFSLVGGIVFYFIEPKNSFIRFHALQSAYLGAIGAAFGILLPIIFTILAAIPVIGWLIGIILAIFVPLFGVAFAVIWIIAVFQALKGSEWEIPWLGKLARKHLAEGLFFFVKSPVI